MGWCDFKSKSLREKELMSFIFLCLSPEIYTLPLCILISKPRHSFNFLLFVAGKLLQSAVWQLLHQVTAKWREKGSLSIVWYRSNEEAKCSDNEFPFITPNLPPLQVVFSECCNLLECITCSVWWHSLQMPKGNFGCRSRSQSECVHVRETLWFWQKLFMQLEQQTWRREPKLLTQHNENSNAQCSDVKGDRLAPCCSTVATNCEKQFHRQKLCNQFIAVLYFGRTFWHLFPFCDLSPKAKTFPIKILFTAQRSKTTIKKLSQS